MADMDDLPRIGWREWLSLPALGVDAIKAKVDSGARSSSLHVYRLQRFRRDGLEYVRFHVHPMQRDNRTSIAAEAQVVEHRRVRSSGGHETIRPVIVTEIELLGRRFAAEITLARRDAMGFRMLLGREAVRGRFVIDPGRSYLGGRELRRRYSRRKGKQP